MLSSRTAERILLLGALGLALTAAGVGVWLAIMTGDPHWLNRAGAAITATEAVIVLAEFQRRERLGHARIRLERRRRDRSLNTERAGEIIEDAIRRAERRVLLVAVSLAMFGEVLHGFGDLLFEAVESHLH
ncbi:MAG: hypothetical protein WAQ99_09290 [Pyrinomonadaceae bacterium]